MNWRKINCIQQHQRFRQALAKKGNISLDLGGNLSGLYWTFISYAAERFPQQVGKQILAIQMQNDNLRSLGIKRRARMGDVLTVLIEAGLPDANVPRKTS